MDDEQSYEGAYEARKSAHKSDAVYEVRPIRKRVWTPAEKLTILQEGMAPGAVPADVMRRYGISSSLYYTWRGADGLGRLMFTLAAHVRIFIACGVTDMRKGFNGLAARIENDLKADPYGGALYIFRGRRGDIVKSLYWDGQGLVLYAKRLEKGRFTWPQAKDGVVSLTTAQLAMLAEGIDWRMPSWSARPTPERDA